MSSGLASDEVAEDYKNSLEDLTFNSRWEISNLTVIAKENMDHALAISRVIENHIKSVRNLSLLMSNFNLNDRVLYFTMLCNTSLPDCVFLLPDAMNLTKYADGNDVRLLLIENFRRFTCSIL
jgi:hypothetical protein